MTKRCAGDAGKPITVPDTLNLNTGSYNSVAEGLSAFLLAGIAAHTAYVFYVGGIHMSMK